MRMSIEVCYLNWNTRMVCQTYQVLRGVIVILHQCLTVRRQEARGELQRKLKNTYLAIFYF